MFAKWEMQQINHKFNNINSFGFDIKPWILRLSHLLKQLQCQSIQRGYWGWYEFLGLWSNCNQFHIVKVTISPPNFISIIPRGYVGFMVKYNFIIPCLKCGQNKINKPIFHTHTSSQKFHNGFFIHLTQMRNEWMMSAIIYAIVRMTWRVATKQVRQSSHQQSSPITSAPLGIEDNRVKIMYLTMGKKCWVSECVWVISMENFILILSIRQILSYKKIYFISILSNSAYVDYKDKFILAKKTLIHWKQISPCKHFSFTRSHESSRNIQHR